MKAGPALLLVFGLFLVGGAISLARQAVPRPVTTLVGVCAALSLAAGVLWL